MGTQTFHRNGSSKRSRARDGQSQVDNRLPPLGVAQSIGSMVGDVVSLSELQLQLFKRDSTAALQRTYLGAAVAIVGGLILLACLPVALMALAYLLNQNSELSLGLCFALVSGVGVLSGGAITFFGVRKLRKVGNVYRRSQDEFKRNVQWLKTALKR